MKTLLVLSAICWFAACAERPPAPKPVEPAPPPPPPTSPPMVKPPAKVEVKKLSAVIAWHMQNGKILEDRSKGQVILRSKTKKGAALTETCWDHGRFAVVESRASNELGAGEILLRFAGPKSSSLCAPDFKGRIQDLEIGEGFLAGVAGDMIVVEGADDSEVLREFQIFAVSDGRELFKGRHHPAQEFTLMRQSGRSSLTYFSRLKVECELALEGESCWRKVLQLNEIPRALAVPDCARAFAKKGVDKTESALVTARARVADLRTPKLLWLSGQATCEPEP